MCKYILFSLSTFILSSIMGQGINVRHQKDTVGFASKAWQMDNVMNRIKKQYSKYYDNLYKKQNLSENDFFRFAVCPHDDYSYAGFLYNEVFSHIKVKTFIILGVAHKAKYFNIEQKIVFDAFDHWHAPYGNIKISPLRQQLIYQLP